MAFFASLRAFVSALASGTAGKGASLVAIETGSVGAATTVQGALVACATGASAVALEALLGASDDVAEGAVMIGVFDAGELLTATNVEAALAELATGAAAIVADLASTDNAEGAALVGIEDAGELFTAANVEAALAELRALVNAQALVLVSLASRLTTAEAAIDALEGA